MKSRSAKKTQEFPDNYRSGLQPYIENTSLQNDIEEILSHRHSFLRMKELALLHTRYTSSLSHGHIDYYVKQQKKALRNRFLGAVCILLIAAYFIFTLYRIHDSYLAYHNLDISDDAFQKAVEYYENGEYPAALLRFKTLYDNEWNSTLAVHYLSSIYQNQENYDAAAEVLLDYLINRYGLVNISTDNTIYTELRDLYINKPLSAETAGNISNAFKLINGYSSIYSQLFIAIHEQDYDEADYLCQNLKSVYADGYYFVSCYSNVLVNTNRVEDAYNLIMETVRNDRTPQMRMISTRQRISLVNYIIPYLNGIQQTECNTFLSHELADLNTVSDSDSAEPYVSYGDVERQFKYSNSIESLKYLSPLDNLTVYEETTLINAKELYCIELIHHDGSRLSKKYFFMDMNQNIYLLMNDKYLLLPTDEPSNPPAELTGTVRNSYTLYEDPDIILDYQYDENNNQLYTLKNISSGEIIFNGAHTSFSTYGAVAYIQKDNACFTVFASIDDAVILVTKDPEQKFTYLEGRYLKEAVSTNLMPLN